MTPKSTHLGTILCSCLLLAACPDGGETTASDGTTGTTGATSSGTDTTGPTPGDTTTGSSGTTTTGDPDGGSSSTTTDDTGGPEPLDCDDGQLSVVGSERAFCLALFQADREVDEGTEPDSAWGLAELTYEGEADLLHFNLEVDGVPRVIDIPVNSVDGEVRQSVVFAFDLDVSPGTDVSSLMFAAELTPGPLRGASLLAEPAPLEPLPVAEFTGEPGTLIMLDEPPASLDSGGGAQEGATPHKNSNFPNQEAGTNECVPAAISNSMMFLNSTHMLGMTADQMSIDTWKEGTGWGRNGSPVGWWNAKAKYLEANGYPVSSTTSTSAADATQALDDDCDIELRVPGHAGALVGMTALENGTYSIDVAHDIRQGQMGGTVTETGIFNPNPAPGTISGITWMNGKNLGVFVIECPQEE